MQETAAQAGPWVAGNRRSRIGPRLTKANIALLRLAVLVAFILVWWLLTLWVSRSFLPTPWATVQAAVSMVRDGSIAREVPRGSNIHRKSEDDSGSYSNSSETMKVSAKHVAGHAGIGAGDDDVAGYRIDVHQGCAKGTEPGYDGRRDLLARVQWHMPKD